jgi:hypothetical protein
MMNIEQLIELVEKGLEDSSSVTGKELEAAYAAVKELRADAAADAAAAWLSAALVFFGSAGVLLLMLLRPMN